MPSFKQLNICLKKHYSMRRIIDKKEYEIINTTTNILLQQN